VKRILIFSSGSALYGAEKGVLHLIEAFKETCAITVVLPRDGVLAQRLSNIGGNIDVKIFPLPVLRHSVSPFYYLLLLVKTLIASVYFICYVFSKKVDFVCTNTFLLPFTGIVCVVSRKYHIWYIREFFSSSWVNKILGILVVRTSRRVVCQSKTIRNKLSLPKETAVIYEPLMSSEYTLYDKETARRELKLSLDATVVSLISRIHPRKGQYEFIEEISDLLKTNRNITVLVVGDATRHTPRAYAYKRKIEDFIAHKGLTNVMLLGHRQDVDRILSASDLCVFPFRGEEPFGIAVAEALAFGKRTFYPRQGGLQEVYDIFKEGEEIDVGTIERALASVTEQEGLNAKELRIPDILSFSHYQQTLRTIFHG